MSQLSILLEFEMRCMTYHWRDICSLTTLIVPRFLQVMLRLLTQRTTSVVELRVQSPALWNRRCRHRYDRPAYMPPFEQVGSKLGPVTDSSPAGFCIVRIRTESSTIANYVIQNLVMLVEAVRIVSMFVSEHSRKQTVLPQSLPLLNSST